MEHVLLVVACVVIGVLRLVLPSRGLDTRDLFKDAAHLFVGGLVGAASVSGEVAYWWMVGCLSALEVFAALVKGRAR